MAVHALALPNDSTEGTSTDSAEFLRLSLGGLLTAGAGTLDARSGLLPAPNAAKLTAVSAMSCQIAPFQAWVDGTARDTQGGYLTTSTANELVSFADGETNVARVDRIIAQIQHDSYDQSGVRKAQVTYLRGQTNGVASPLPASSLLLYEMTVPAGTSAGTGGLAFVNAVDLRSFTVTRGGVLPVANQAARDTLTPQLGQPIWRTDYSWIEVYDGTSWRVQGMVAVPAVASLTRITYPLTGQMAFDAGGVQLYRYDGAVWARYPAAATVAADVMNTSRGSTRSNTYTSALDTSTDDPINVVFTPPPSGAVWVTVSARIEPSSGESFASFRITLTSSGATVVDANDARSISSAWNGALRVSRRMLVTGLTAGTQYTCTMLFRVASGTSNFDGNDLIVESSV